MAVIADISHHQGTIDWSKLSKVLDLAIIRLQYGASSVDGKYKEYVAGCKAHNVPFGHYAYGRFVDVNDAIDEAKAFIARADKDAKFLVVDVEEQTCKNVKDLVPATQAFIDTCKKAGWKIGLYTGHSFYSEYGMKKVVADFLWIPRYASSDNGTIPSTASKPSMSCELWQYTEKGKLSGIKGFVDLNQLNGSKSLAWFTGKEAQPQTASKPTPAPAKPAPKPVPKPNPVYEKVGKGDTMWDFAQKHKVSVESVQKLNPGVDPKKLQFGQRIRVK